MADLTAATLARIPEAIDAIPAVVETASPLTVTIDGATHAALSWMGVWQHAATDRVLVIRSRGRVVIVGSLATRPTSAIVGSTGSGRATVTDDGGRTISGLPYVGTAPGNGTRVGIVWGQDGGYISGVLSATVGGVPGTVATVDPDPPELPGSSESGTSIAPAVASATARSGAWRTDGTTPPRYAMQGHWTSGSTADNSGFWFYGHGLVVAGATASGVGSIRLKRDSATGMSTAANIYLARHGAHTKPGSPPALIGSAVLIGSLRYGQTGTFALPAGFAQDLLDGTAGGVAISYAGTTHYAALTGPSVDPSAALISLPYTREA